MVSGTYPGASEGAGEPQNGSCVVIMLWENGVH